MESQGMRCIQQYNSSDEGGREFLPGLTARPQLKGETQTEHVGVDPDVAAFDTGIG